MGLLGSSSTVEAKEEYENNVSVINLSLHHIQENIYGVLSVLTFCSRYEKEERIVELEKKSKVEIV